MKQRLRRSGCTRSASFPGLLQTPEYAAALAAATVKRGAITPEQGDERIALVARRQASLDRMPPPLVFAVLDESCLRRPVGDSAIMEAQFDAAA